MSSLMTAPPVGNDLRSELMTRLFSELQTARFNELYYQRRASFFRGLSIGANIVSALTASAALASLLADANQSGWGPLLWKSLTGVAAISAAVGPVLGLDSKASQMEKAALGHSVIKDRVRRLLSDLKVSDLEESHLARDREIDSFRSALTPFDESPSDRVREECWKQTEEELPSDKAWTLV
jgi:hypothetical protein